MRLSLSLSRSQQFMRIAKERGRARGNNHNTIAVVLVPPSSEDASREKKEGALGKKRGEKGGNSHYDAT